MTCPICRKSFEMPAPEEQSYLPFCSDRCRLVDLGRWLSGKYQIPVRNDNESNDPEGGEGEGTDSSEARP